MRRNPIESLFGRKIDPSTAQIASIHVSESWNYPDGTLPAEDVELVVARRRGIIFSKQPMMVQVGLVNENGGPMSFSDGIYRPEVTYEASKRGKDVFIDIGALRNGAIEVDPNKQALWIPLPKVGIRIDGR